MIKTDIIIIGAGPTGLFAVFEAGLLKLKCHLIDSLAQPGGQCAEIYPKKPIYDIPSRPEIMAGDLVDQLMEQIHPFQPGFTLGETAQDIEKQADGSFVVTTDKGTQHHAPVVAIAGGLGNFEPRKPDLPNLLQWEDKGVDYIIKDPEKYRNKKVLIAGGGDSALDWTIVLASVAEQVTLIHRRNEFRGALDSVEKVQALKNQNKIQTITFRNVNHQKISNSHNLEYGFESLKNYTDYNFIRGNDGEFDVNEKISVLNLASFLSIKSKILNQIILSSGIRFDFNDYEKSIFLSPRINIDYNIFDKTNLIYNIGNYYQNPPEIYLSVNENDLRSVHNIQQSLTLEHIFFKDTKFSFSIYNKDYSNAPILKPDSNYIDPTFLMDQLIMYDKIVSKGKANSKGLEILLQKKRVEKFYGLIGATYFNSLFKDFDGNEWNRNYNYKYIFNMVGGYRPNDQWEISVRWSLFGGKPYTPIDETSSSIFETQVLYLDDFNGEKTPEYHSLFLRYERRLNLKRSNLITYIELWNAYNRENIETVFWSEELNEIAKETYFDFIPVGGFELEF